MRLSKSSTRRLIRAALREDAATHDATSRAVIPANLRVRATIIAKSPGILAGAPVAAWTLLEHDPTLRCRLLLRDGSRLTRGTAILTVHGRARAILAAERTALNLLGHLSGIATLTRRFVERVRGTRAQILDTRKTLPGLRALEKYAVRVGGGQNHRNDLAEAILIKTNHLRACGMRHAECGIDIQGAIIRARHVKPRRFVEVEVTNLQEFAVALQARPDAILLDNWLIPEMRKAVRLRHSAPRTPHSALLLEVSGGVTLRNVRAIADTSVERISIGRLTHSAPWLDMALRIDS